jgi:HPt (histidine-containing phosphotransfer) domain-containing protein
VDFVLVIGPNPDQFTPLLPSGCVARPSLDVPEPSGSRPRAIVLENLELADRCHEHYPETPILNARAADLGEAIKKVLRANNTRHLLESASLAKLYQLGGRELADKVLDGFQANALDSAYRYRKLWQEGKLEQSLSGVQQLRQQAGRVGATTLQDLCARLEDSLHRGAESSELQLLWAQLKTTLQAVTRMLEQQRRQERTA